MCANTPAQSKMSLEKKLLRLKISVNAQIDKIIASQKDWKVKKNAPIVQPEAGGDTDAEDDGAATDVEEEEKPMPVAEPEPEAEANPANVTPYKKKLPIKSVKLSKKDEKKLGGIPKFYLSLHETGEGKIVSSIKTENEAAKNLVEENGIFEHILKVTDAAIGHVAKTDYVNAVISMLRIAYKDALGKKVNFGDINAINKLLSNKATANMDKNQTFKFGDATVQV